MEARNNNVEQPASHLDIVADALDRADAYSNVLITGPLGISKALIFPGGDTDPDNKRSTYVKLGIMTLPLTLLATLGTASLGLARLAATAALSVLLIPAAALADRLEITDDEITDPTLKRLNRYPASSTKKMMAAIHSEQTNDFRPATRVEVENIGRTAEEEALIEETVRGELRLDFEILPETPNYDGYRPCSR